VLIMYACEEAVYEESLHLSIRPIFQAIRCNEYKPNYFHIVLLMLLTTSLLYLLRRPTSLCLVIFC